MVFHRYKVYNMYNIQRCSCYLGDRGLDIINRVLQTLSTNHPGSLSHLADCLEFKLEGIMNKVNFPCNGFIMRVLYFNDINCHITYKGKFRTRFLYICGENILTHDVACESSHATLTKNHNQSKHDIIEASSYGDIYQITPTPKERSWKGRQKYSKTQRIREFAVCVSQSFQKLHL